MESLRHRFPGLDNLSTNYSAACQDMFALMMLNGKRDGFFLEIGAQHAVSGGNNTYLLEKEFGWNGISVDRTEDSLSSFKEHRRKANFILSDALEIDYAQAFRSVGCSRQIDYLSLDIEPAEQTLACLKKLPLDNYRFSVITYETDFYNQPNGLAHAERIKEESREIFLSHGYELIVGDLADFEDWYVDPSIVDRSLIEKMKESSAYKKTPLHYIYNIK